MPFIVDASTCQVKTFESAKDAVAYASLCVSLGWDKRETAVATLESGKVYEYSYGFVSATITPLL